jgi:hypothetical protein
MIVGWYFKAAYSLIRFSLSPFLPFSTRSHKIIRLFLAYHSISIEIFPESCRYKRNLQFCKTLKGRGLQPLRPLMSSAGKEVMSIECRGVPKRS